MEKLHRHTSSNNHRRIQSLLANVCLGGKCQGATGSVTVRGCSPSSPTAAPSLSSLWPLPSVSPRAGVWLPSPRRCPSASGSRSRLSTACAAVNGKSTQGQPALPAAFGELVVLSSSPSGLVVELVFQLADFLLDHAHPFSVYEHRVLLKSQ